MLKLSDGGRLIPCVCALPSGPVLVCFLSLVVLLVFSSCVLPSLLPWLFPLLPCGVLTPCHVVERHPFGVCCGSPNWTSSAWLVRSVWLPCHLCPISRPEWRVFCTTCCGQRFWDMRHSTKGFDSVWGLVPLHHVDCPCPSPCPRRDGISTCALVRLCISSPTTIVPGSLLLISPPLLSPALLVCGVSVCLCPSGSGFVWCLCLAVVWVFFFCPLLLVFGWCLVAPSSLPACTTQDWLSGYHPGTEVFRTVLLPCTACHPLTTAFQTSTSTRQPCKYRGSMQFRSPVAPNDFLFDLLTVNIHGAETICHCRGGAAG